MLPGQPRDQWMYRVGSARIEKQMIGDNQPGTTPAPDDMGVAMGLYAWARPCARSVAVRGFISTRSVLFGNNHGTFLS